MYIVGTTEIDRQGRINISGLFGSRKVRKVVVAIDPGEEAILLKPIPEGSEEADIDSGVPSKIDDKNRIIVPKWVRDELGTTTKFSLVYNNGDYYIFPKTGSLIPSASAD